MARNIDSTMGGHLGDGVVCPLILAQITFKSQTVFCWSGTGTLVWDGHDFLGVGSMGEVGSIVEGVDVEAHGLSIGLSGIDPVLKAECLTDIQQGAPAKLWFALADPATGAILGTPYLFFSGAVDKPVLSIGGQTIGISLALESRMVNMQRANNRRYTSADQRLTYPTDSAFAWVEQLNDLALIWG